MYPLLVLQKNIHMICFTPENVWYDISKMGQNLNRMQNQNDAFRNNYKAWTNKSISEAKSRIWLKNVGRQARNSFWKVAPYGALIPASLSGMTNGTFTTEKSKLKLLCN